MRTSNTRTPSATQNAYDPPAASAARCDTTGNWRSLFRIVLWFSLAGVLGLLALFLFVAWLLPAPFGIELVGIEFR